MVSDYWSDQWVSVTHATLEGSYAVPAGLGELSTHDPALKRWASICRPLAGTGIECGDRDTLPPPGRALCVPPFSPGIETGRNPNVKRAAAMAALVLIGRGYLCGIGAGWAVGALIPVCTLGAATVAPRPRIAPAPGSPKVALRDADGGAEVGGLSDGGGSRSEEFPGG